MKELFALMLVVAMVLSLAACSTPKRACGTLRGRAAKLPPTT